MEKLSQEYQRMKPLLIEITNILKRIEELLWKPDFEGRIKTLTDNYQKLKGDHENQERRLRAMEKYLKVEYIQSAEYKKVK